MKILKQFFSVLFVLLCVVGTGYAATFDGVRELVSRRAPWLGKHIQFKEIASSDGDCFILQTVGKKLWYRPREQMRRQSVSTGI